MIPIPRQPTYEEHREASLAWYARCKSTLLDQLPKEILDLSMPTKFIEFPKELTEVLFEPNRREELNDFAAELDAAMGWDTHFIKLNSRSPKDWPWPFEIPATCSGKEALNILGSSERILEDLIQFKYLPEQPVYVCLREFVPIIRSNMEYRCFVKDYKIIAVSYYDYTNPINAPADKGKETRTLIDNWYREKLEPCLHVKDVVFDLFINWNNDIILIELNPYGLSDPCCLESYENVENFNGYVAYPKIEDNTPYA